MNIHEYQAKELLRQAGIPVQPGEVATTPDEAEAIARRTDGAVVVKAQVHAGGRGKAGGVKLAKTPTEARTAAERILGMSIKGLVVQRVLVAEAADIGAKSYVGIIIDRVSKRPVVMVSPAGGMDIEEVAATLLTASGASPSIRATAHEFRGDGPRLLPLQGPSTGARRRAHPPPTVRRVHGARVRRWSRSIRW